MSSCLRGAESSQQALHQRDLLACPAESTFLVGSRGHQSIWGKIYPEREIWAKQLCEQGAGAAPWRSLWRRALGDVKTAPCRAASVGGGAKGRKEGVHFKRSRGGKRKLLGSSLDRNVSNLLRHETPLACVRLTHFWRRRPLKRAGFPLGGVSIEQLKHQGKRGWTRGPSFCSSSAPKRVCGPGGHVAPCCPFSRSQAAVPGPGWSPVNPHIPASPEGFAASPAFICSLPLGEGSRQRTWLWRQPARCQALQ